MKISVFFALIFIIPSITLSQVIYENFELFGSFGYGVSSCSTVNGKIKNQFHLGDAKGGIGYLFSNNNMSAGLTIGFQNCGASNDPINLEYDLFLENYMFNSQVVFYGFYYRYKPKIRDRRFTLGLNLCHANTRAKFGSNLRTHTDPNLSYSAEFMQIRKKYNFSNLGFLVEPQITYVMDNWARALNEENVSLYLYLSYKYVYENIPLKSERFFNDGTQINDELLIKFRSHFYSFGVGVSYEF